MKPNSIRMDFKMPENDRVMVLTSEKTMIKKRKNIYKQIACEQVQ